ncbi:hypothetical protein BH11PSE3_BH11PSE3_03990 [soil metagenome]
MATPRFPQLVAEHPEILTDRPALSFAREAAAADAAAEWRRSGVVMLRGVLPTGVLAECRQTFDRFINDVIKKNRDDRLPRKDGALTRDGGPSTEWDNGEIEFGSWHAPWVVRHGGYSPMAVVVSQLVNSWAWPVIEEICHSQDIMLMFGLCLARHNIDRELHVGIHQDATAVNPDVPLSIWIPLQDVVPRYQSGLGFVVPSPGHVLPAGANNDIGADYVYSQVNNIWVPQYHAGDLTIHSKFSPHFTTGYGTQTDRYSLEIRLWARDDAFTQYYDPSIRICRRDGIPVVVETKCSLGIAAHGFLASTALLSMETTASRDECYAPAGEPPVAVNAPSRNVIGALREVAKRMMAPPNP